MPSGCHVKIGSAWMPLLLLAIVKCGCGNGGAGSGIAMTFVWLLLVFSFFLPLSLSFSLFLSLSLSFSLFLSLSLSLSPPSLSLSFSLSLSLSPVNHIPVAMLLPGILSNMLLYTIQLACTKTDSISVLLAVYMVESVELYNAQGFLKGCGEGIFPLGRCLPPFENLY